jgi:hypothetical protein
MYDDSIFEKVREAIRKRGEKPASERIADMIERGVIDKSGRVLLRMPSGPKNIPSKAIKDGTSKKPKRRKKKK